MRRNLEKTRVSKIMSSDIKTIHALDRIKKAADMV
jgi:hypothetical protein